MMKNYITVKEAAKKIGVNINTIYKLRDSGLVPFIKLGTWKVAEEDLQNFFDENPGVDILLLTKKSENI